MLLMTLINGCSVYGYIRASKNSLDDIEKSVEAVKERIEDEGSDGDDIDVVA